MARTSLIVIDGQVRGKTVKQHGFMKFCWTVFCIAAVIGLLASVPW